ncbi:MAG TPA: histidine phosphatase family protein, partial [Acidimicrobiales bacterium]|nr:histidine phosphatase family protein [Acidimicrobiales bacterium]
MPADPSRPQVWVARHGETDWSRSGQHTSRTDVDLTAQGEKQARALGSVLVDIDFDLVMSSPMLRARRTAELAGMSEFVEDPDLREWDYGQLEGRTTPEIQENLPGWSIWTGPWPDAETADEVARRGDRVVESLLSSGAAQIAVFSHGHFIRVLASRWVDAPIETGGWLDLDT